MKYCKYCEEPPQNPRNLPTELPVCPADGSRLILHPLANQTYEQRFSGVWYNCPHCFYSVLFQSAECRKFLMEMCARKDCGLKTGHGAGMQRELDFQVEEAEA